MDIRPLQRGARYICLSVCKEKQQSSASQNCIHDFLLYVHVFCDILATFTTRFHCTWSHLIIRDFSHPWKDLGNKWSSKWIKIPITTSSQIFTNQLMYKIFTMVLASTCHWQNPCLRSLLHSMSFQPQAEACFLLIIQDMASVQAPTHFSS